MPASLGAATPSLVLGILFGAAMYAVAAIPSAHQVRGTLPTRTVELAFNSLMICLFVVLCLIMTEQRRGGVWWAHAVMAWIGLWATVFVPGVLWPVVATGAVTWNTDWFGLKALLTVPVLVFLATAPWIGLASFLGSWLGRQFPPIPRRWGLRLIAAALGLFFLAFLISTVVRAESLVLAAAMWGIPLAAVGGLVLLGYGRGQAGAGPPLPL
ncbi:MAG: hypothetical protein V4510_05235 [bacterium]